MISTRRFCGSRTPSAVGTSGLLSPKPRTEIADRIYRISTWVPDVSPEGFTFNQYLIVDELPLLFHSGLRKMFPLVRDAVASVIPIQRLKYVGLSHVEADECGSINEWLGPGRQWGTEREFFLRDQHPGPGSRRS